MVVSTQRKLEACPDPYNGRYQRPDTVLLRVSFLSGTPISRKALRGPASRARPLAEQDRFGLLVVGDV